MILLRYDPSRGAFSAPSVCCCCLAPRSLTEERAVSPGKGAARVAIPWCAACSRRSRLGRFIAGGLLLACFVGGFAANRRLSLASQRWLGLLLGEFVGDLWNVLTLVASLAAWFVLWRAVVRLITPSGHAAGCDAVAARAAGDAAGVVEIEAENEAFAEALLRENPAAVSASSRER